MNRLLLIANSSAGTNEAESLEAALDVLRSGATVEVAQTSDADELDDVLAQADRDVTLVVAGGDGSMHAVVQALHRLDDLTGRRLALIPLGTGNDLARNLGLPLEPAEAARVVLEGRARPTDLMVDQDGSVVVNNVHVGAGAEAARYGARWKERLGSVGVGKVNLGKLGYPIGAVQSAFFPNTFRLRVEVDGEVIVGLDRKVLMVAVGNGSSVGGGTELNPEADAHDGKLDIMVSLAAAPAAQVGYLVGLVRGTHEDRDDVRAVRGTSVTITGRDPFHCSADGELSDPVRTRTWRILPHAYELLVPR